jgi:LPXTG-motif cell wall-anchored protein
MLMALLEFLDYIVPTWMTDTWFLVLGAVVLIALIVVYFMIRNKRTADED